MSQLESFTKHVFDAARVLGVKENSINIFLKPNQVHTKDVSVRLLSGETQSLKMYRVQFNNARGPYKGGVRFHLDANRDEVTTLAGQMAIKTAVVNIPMGGAKGGAQVNTKKLTRKDLEVVSRAWVRAFSKNIGPNKDIPAPDIATNSQTMAWMLDEYESIVGHSSPGVFTAKPIALGGVKGRNGATGTGGSIVLQSLLKKHNITKKLKIVVQGAGKVGLKIAELLQNQGHTIIAISDSSGGVHNESGLDIGLIKKHKKEKLKIVDLKSLGKIISVDQMVTIRTDLLVLAALEDQINKNNAQDISASIILELANGPITYQADKILEKNNVMVIPDVLANAGGVVVSWLEWMQNLQGSVFTEEQVKERLEEIMLQAEQEVTALSKKNKVSLRGGAYILALQKIIQAEQLRGRV